MIIEADIYLLCEKNMKNDEQMYSYILTLMLKN